MSLHREVLSSYKTLLRTFYSVFKGDKATLKKSITHAKSFYYKNKTDIEEHLKIAHQVNGMIRTNVVQGVKKGDRWELNIRDEIKRNDNDDVRKASSCKN